MKLTAAGCILLALLVSATAQQTNQVSIKPSKPIADMGALQFIPSGVVAGREPGTTAVVPPCIRVEFKIKDKSVTKLDTAAVHLFDKEGKLVQTLTKIDPSGYFPIPTSGGTPKKQSGRYQNMITELTDLRAGASYNLIFPSPDKKSWKTVIAVVGDSTIPSCVYKTMPTNVDVMTLEFKEKPFSIKN